MNPILTITITKDHVKLIRELGVGWDNAYFGSPSIDPKRPYGNSLVFHDIAEILGIVPNTDTDDGYMTFSNTQKEYMTNIHRELQYVIQIGFQFGRFVKGEYTTTDNVSWDSHPKWVRKK